MHGNKMLIWTLGSIAAAALAAGCGSALKEGDISGGAGEGYGTDPATGLSFVGAAACIRCHQGFSWSSALVGGYLAGRHVVHSTHVTAEGAESEGCTCHDPIGDGPSLEGYISTLDVPAAGLAAVGCENCHGAGGGHWGTGPMPNAAPGPEVCGGCHDAIPVSHNTHHPEALDIYTRFTDSQHWNASVRNEAECAKCHTDEGARLYKDYMTREQLELLVLPVPTGSPVQCRTCHDPHNAGGLLKEAVEDHGEVTESAQYATCTNCHGKDNAVISADPAVNELQYHEDRYFRIIADSHYDDPATLGTIEGYILDRTNDHVCLDCHDVHSVKNINNYDGYATINEQWAKSGHAGFIGLQKSAVALSYKNSGHDRTTEQTIAIRAAGVTPATGAPFVDDPFTAIAEKSCSRCHTSSAARLYLTDPAAYAAGQNDLYDTTGPSGAFRNLTGTVIAAGGATITALQKELIYCWACHTDNAGGVRDPGPITATYDYTSSGVTVLTNSHAYTDLSASNVCVPCHAGRSAGDTVKGLYSANGVTITFGNIRLSGTHYLPAAGLLMSGLGYEFYPPIGSSVAATDYANLPYFEHDAIGRSVTAGIGSSGPCAGCHMTSSTGHLFTPVERDPDSDELLTITSTACAVCHAGAYALTVSALVEAEEGLASAKAALKAALADSTLKPAFYYSAGNFYKTNTSASSSNRVTNWLNTGDGDTTGDASGKNNMGAAFNLYGIDHEAGAYAHNRHYVQLLIFDALDWLDDNVMGGAIDLSAFPAAAEYMRAGYTTLDAIPRP
jgi:hypothetical protein